MPNRTAFTAIAIAAAMTVASAPLASADEPVTTAASWDCTAKWWEAPAPELLSVSCRYGGRYRGVVAFWEDFEPERLVADDEAADHRAVFAELTWTENGQHRSATVRSAGPREEKRVAAPEGVMVWLRLCLEGHSCSSKYGVYA